MSAGESTSRDGAPAYVQFTPEQLQLASGTPVGAGAISQVVRSTLATSGLPVVVKILSKIQLLQQRKVESVMNEKAALLRLGPHPFIARLYGTAQSEDELYFALEHLPHGDLLQHVRRTASQRLVDYTRSQRGEGAASVPDGRGAYYGVSTGVARPTTAAAAAGEVVASPLDDLSSDLTTTTSATATLTDAEIVPIPVSSTALRCLDLNDIRLITAQLVLALARAYETGVVLRDLKPENIVFDAKYRACLIDFDTADLSGRVNVPETNRGVALRPAEGEAQSGVGASGASSSPSVAAAPPTPIKRISVSEIQAMRRKTASFCGTAQYVSPEMVGECKWSFSSDLWALGATVYEMLYGAHMFPGLGAFEVLQKVVKGIGSGAVSFPRVALGATDTSHSDAATTDTAAASHADVGSGFDALKDFICQLVNTDPLLRLGVDRKTRGFDLAAIKAHALFNGFDWTIVESHLTSFRPRNFPRKGDTNPNAAGVAAEAVTVAADPDPSPSLKPHYHLLPFDDPRYADYVYRATADANPFERFMRHIILDEGSDDAKAAEGVRADVKQLSSSPTPAAATTAAKRAATDHSVASTPSSGPSLRFVNNSEDDDVMHVIDDVGINYTGLSADEDFQK